jgi:murein endopeptidase
MKTSGGMKMAPDGQCYTPAAAPPGTRWRAGWASHRAGLDVVVVVVVTETILNVTVFWDVATYSLVEIDRLLEVLTVSSIRASSH